MKRALPLMRSRARILIGLAVCMIIAAAFIFGHHAGQAKTSESSVQRIKTTASPIAKTSLSANVTSVKSSVSIAGTAACASNPGGRKLLLISVSTQHLWACDGTSMASQSAVTTGASQAPNGVDDSTPTGTWRIYSKQTNQHLRGSDINGSWDDAVAYWMPFDDQVGFHDASWQTFPFGSSQYATSGSHGCVHLPTDFAGWVYNWAPIGTTVTVVS